MLTYICHLEGQVRSHQRPSLITALTSNVARRSSPDYANKLSVTMVGPYLDLTNAVVRKLIMLYRDGCLHEGSHLEASEHV